MTAEELIAQLLDSRVPKTEREHAAAREIERLRASKRDQFAMAAMSQMLVSVYYSHMPFGGLAKSAYELADAMLAESAKEKP